MRALLEKTIFQVDVMTLEVRLGEETARRIEEIAAGRSYSSALEDSIAAAAVGATDAFARSRFLRDVSLGQFLDGVRGNMRRALRAGIITQADYDLVSAGLARWFAFLEERGILDGDQIVYRIRGDSLRTQYRAVTGAVLLDQVDVGPERRLTLLGSYFAPKSDFRRNLIRSLFPDGS